MKINISKDHYELGKTAGSAAALIKKSIANISMSIKQILKSKHIIGA